MTHAPSRKRDSLLIAHEKVNEKGSCCGRKTTTLCDCISQKTLFTIATVVGALMLSLGLVALAGYFAPSTGGNFAAFLQKINGIAAFVASKLGSDLLTLAIFSTAMGGAFGLTGTVGLLVLKNRKNLNPLPA